jgi:integrase
MPRPRWGTVRQLPSGRWQARYPFKGERIPLNRTFATESEAWDALAAKKKEIQDGQHIDVRDGRTLLKVSAEKWKTSSAFKRNRQTTRKRDIEYLERYVIPRFGEISLADIDFSMADEWIVSLAEQGGVGGNPLASSTVILAGGVLSKVLKEAVKSRCISHNPFDEVTLPKAGKKRMNIITESEISALAGGFDPRYKAFPIVACYTALRASECFGLRWRDVHFTGTSGPYLEVTTTTIDSGELLTDQEPKSDAGQRSVPLSAVPLQALLDHKAKYPGGPDDYVFLAPLGGPVRLNNFRKRFWKSAVKAAGIKSGFTIHDCRHTAISLWIAAGADAKQVSTFAGHTSVSFTLDRYGHLYPTSGESFIQKLNAATALALAAEDEGTEIGHDASGQLAEIIELHPDVDIDGGARKNRTFDLSIISAAL